MPSLFHALIGFAAAITVVTTSACAPHAIVFATSTSTGIDISATSEQSGEVIIGHRRMEGATMPTTVSVGGKSQSVQKAYPLLAAYKLDTGAVWPPDRFGHATVTQVFATGRAAMVPTAPAAVATAFEAASGIPASMPDEEATTAAEACMNLLEDERDATRLRRMLDATNEVLAPTPAVTDRDGARGAIRTAQTNSGTAALKQLRTRLEAERDGRR